MSDFGLPMPTIRPNPSACKFDAVYEGIWEIVRRNHRPGENDLETVTRMLINEALAHFGGSQYHSGQALGISRRRMNYICANLRLRPTDTDPNTRRRGGRKPKTERRTGATA